MADDDNGDDLKSFKIGDLKRPEVKRFSKTVEKDEAEESISVGFPSIEARLEEGDIDALASELSVSYEKLEKLADSGDMKVKASANKAMAAYERTADLFEYLFATKAALQAPPEGGEE